MSCEDKSQKANKAGEKKIIKRNKLYDAAFDLFTTKGMHETVIDDIVKKAGVAKGTFYLYFKDKYDLLDRIIYKQSASVIKEAFEFAQSKASEGNTDVIDGIIFFIDYLIEYFKHNKKMLRLIYKNLSWGLYSKVVADSENLIDTKSILKKITEKFDGENRDLKVLDQTIYMIIELVSSVCYSSIVLEEPYKIDEIKPVLYKTIRNMLIQI